MSAINRRWDHWVPALFDDLPVGAFVHQKGTILYANGHAAHQLGFDEPEDLAGSAFMDIVAEESQQLIQHCFRYYRRAGSYDTCLSTRDGRTIRVNLSSAIVDSDEAGSVRLTTLGPPLWPSLLRGKPEGERPVLRVI